MIRMLSVIPNSHTVMEFFVPEDDTLAAMQEVVGGSIEAAVDVEVPRVGNGLPRIDTLFVNEEGLFAPNPAFFCVTTDRGLIGLAGPGVVAGFDPASGETISAAGGVDFWMGRVRFVTLAEIRRLATRGLLIN